MTIDRSTLTAHKILEKYIDPKIAHDPNTGCWIWTGYTGANGTSTVRLPLMDSKKRATFQVARFIHEASHGKITHGLWFARQCKTRCCVNPDHFRAGNPIEILKEVNNRLPRRVACEKGHTYTKNNKIASNGARICNTCNNIRAAGYRRKNLIKLLGYEGLLEEFELSQRLAPRPKKYYVYHLIDPATKEVFYIGKGCGKRALQHVREAIEDSKVNPDKNARIRLILNEGLKVRIVIVQRNLTEERAFLLEKKEIARIGLENLTNRSCGIRHLALLRHNI